MDTLEALSGGASGAKSDGPDDNMIAPSFILHPTALPRDIAATAPTPSNRNSVECEPYIYHTDDFYN